MLELDNKILEQFKVKSCQSIRHLLHNGQTYAIFITNRFRKIGWIYEKDGKYYGAQAKMILRDKDDIIDFYVAMDTNAKASIEELCKESQS